MKKARILIIGMMCTIMGTTMLQAQSQTEDYFAGKWELLAENVQGSDVKMELIVSRVDGKLKATLTGLEGGAVKINSLTEHAEPLAITVNFTTPDESYDVDIYLKKKDANNIVGDIMNMFDIKGKRLPK